jgi:hypothetical protein
MKIKIFYFIQFEYSFFFFEFFKKEYSKTFFAPFFQLIENLTTPTSFGPHLTWVK